MVKRFLRAVWLIALPLVAWSCDDFHGPIEPELAPRQMVLTSTSGTKFVIAYEWDPAAGSISGEIGTAGGVLVLGYHALWVSPDAVSAPTKFTMTRDLEHPLRVKLTAGRDAENDVGAGGFAAPVYLGLSYANVSGVPSDKSSIEVLYMRPDGLVEEVPSAVDLGSSRIVARLPHFSLFTLGWP